MRRSISKKRSEHSRESTSKDGSESINLTCGNMRPGSPQEDTELRTQALATVPDSKKAF